MARVFLTLFPRLKPQYLCKDVGAIPYHLAQSYGWSSAIAYLEDEGQPVDNAGYREKVQLISMGRRGNIMRNALSVLRFLVGNSRKYDVLNLYHESFTSVFFGIVYKLCNPKGFVYIKLDVGTPFMEQYRDDRKTFFGKIRQRIRYLLSLSCVGLYSAETSWAYRLLAHDQYFAGRIMQLTNGIGVGELESDLSVDRKENIILYVGNIGAYAKNCELLVEAVSSLKTTILENWKLYLVGQVVNADCYETGVFTGDDGFNRFLDDVYQRHPVMKNVVVLPGQINDRRLLAELYGKAKIFCLPSRYESFGFVLLEAMYFGNYVISTNVPLIADLVGKGAVGRVVATEDRDAMAVAIESAIAEWDEHIADKLHLNRNIVLEHYDWTAITGALDMQLHQLMADGN